MTEQAKKTSEQDALTVNERKWTKTLMKAGYTVVPNVIIERQAALGLDALDINILMHLCTYWWSPEGKPFPAKGTLAAAIGVKPRSIQRRIQRLEQIGFVRREQRRVKGGASKTNIYHLDGLIKEAKPYAVEKIQESEGRAEERKARAARKGKARLRVVSSAD